MHAPLAALPVDDPVGALLSRCADGDTAAFAELYETVVPRVHGLTLRVLGDPHQAEEVTQEVLLELWRTAERFDPRRGSAQAWITTHAHRRAVDRVRASESGRRRDADHLRRTLVVPYDETADTAHAVIEAAHVRDALSALTPLQRQAIELAYFGGHTHTEVSRLLQIPLGTAKARIRDGLIRLRTVLAGVVAEAV